MIKGEKIIGKVIPPLGGSGTAPPKKQKELYFGIITDEDCLRLKELTIRLNHYTKDPEPDSIAWLSGLSEVLYKLSELDKKICTEVE